jgi:hypothetical protein
LRYRSCCLWISQYRRPSTRRPFRPADIEYHWNTPGGNDTGNAFTVEWRRVRPDNSEAGSPHSKRGNHHSEWIWRRDQPVVHDAGSNSNEPHLLYDL